MDPHELKNETEVILTEITETTESILDTEAKNVNSETSDAIESTSEFVSSEKIISEDIIAEETATETNLVNALTKAEMVEQLKTLLKKEVEVVKNEKEAQEKIMLIQAQVTTEVSDSAVRQFISQLGLCCFG